MKRAIVVGTGAGGALAARELTRSFEVTVLEAGPEFRCFDHDLAPVERLRSWPLLFDPRMIALLFPAMRVGMAAGVGVPAERMALVCGVATGGTTTIATANALRCDEALLERGVDLSPEFNALAAELPISVAHERRWRPITRELFSACAGLGLDPQVTPKLVDYRRCTRCGRCVLGCSSGAKWDSRVFLQQAAERGARVVTRARVERVVIERGGEGRVSKTGRARGVVVRRAGRRQLLAADLVVLAAGGFGTPAILLRSGLPVEERLFVDPVLCVAAPVTACHQDEEVPMPFIVKGDGCIISPYFDYLSFFFAPRWRRPRHDIAALMIKLADSERGVVRARRALPRLSPAASPSATKNLTERDRARLAAATETCTEVLTRIGASRDSLFLGMLNAGHPGGMVPLTGRECDSFHPDRLPANVYLADSSLLPESLGRPPMLTIMAIARRVAALCLERFA